MSVRASLLYIHNEAHLQTVVWLQQVCQHQDLCQIHLKHSQFHRVDICRFVIASKINPWGCYEDIYMFAGPGKSIRTRDPSTSWISLVARLSYVVSRWVHTWVHSPFDRGLLQSWYFIDRPTAAARLVLSKSRLEWLFCAGGGGFCCGGWGSCCCFCGGFGFCVRWCGLWLFPSEKHLPKRYLFVAVILHAARMILGEVNI